MKKSVKRVRRYKSGYINIESHSGRIKAYQSYMRSKKSQIVDQRDLIAYSRMEVAYRSWKIQKTKAARNYFKLAFGDFFGFDFGTKKQSHHRQGLIKQISGFSAISAEIIYYEKKKKKAGYNMINDLQTFLATYEFNETNKDLIAIMDNFSAFVNDTDTGWTRRAMEKLGIGADVSRDEFYKWLWEIKK